MLLVLVVLTSAWTASGADEFVRVEAARFDSVLPEAANDNSIDLDAFLIEARPVTNQQFLEFVTRVPAWRRGDVPTLFADGRYLQRWEGPLEIGSAGLHQPVTDVSWFAATAYCEDMGARLPTWYEWEWVAAADGHRLDARDDDAFRQQALEWYSQSSAGGPHPVGIGQPNIHGVYDMQALVWEWVQDFGGMMVSPDNREQGDPDLRKFCGSGALSMTKRDNYAVLMRIAMLSSLEANYTTQNLGFRCARDLPKAER